MQLKLASAVFPSLTATMMILLTRHRSISGARAFSTCQQPNVPRARRRQRQLLEGARTLAHHQQQQKLQETVFSTRFFSTSTTDLPNNEIETSTKTVPHSRFDASRLGLDPSQNQRHSPLVYHENYSFSNWPEKHTFPMDKFERISHALMTTCRETHPNQSTLPKPLVNDTNDFFRPLEMNDVIDYKPWLTEGPIDPMFVNRFLEGDLTAEECRYIGFREQTSRPELIERTVLEVAGTVLTCQLARVYGLAANVAGGTHHAHPTGGAGYTILNDLAVASHVLLTEKGGRGKSDKKGLQEDVHTKHNNNIERVLVIDTDVHQGDGTAKFGAVEPLKDKMFTLSLHCASNYPHPKAYSTFDVGLPDRMGDDEYMQVLEKSVIKAVSQIQPDFVIYDAGVDVYANDVLGRLKLTEHGIRRRDFFVLDYCVSHGIPVAAVVGGGYDKNVDALARRHAIVHEECAAVWKKYKLWETAPRLRR